MKTQKPAIEITAEDIRKLGALKGLTPEQIEQVAEIFFARPPRSLKGHELPVQHLVTELRSIAREFSGTKSNA